MVQNKKMPLRVDAGVFLHFRNCFAVKMWSKLKMGLDKLFTSL
jgi:hypothetical protein